MQPFDNSWEALLMPGKATKFFVLASPPPFEPDAERYSPANAWWLAELSHAFIVQGVSSHERDAWISWNEDGRLPDLVLELLSPSTAKDDYGTKKRLYQDVFKSSEYFLYEPRGPMADGYRLLDHAYQNIPRSAEGRLWSSLLQVEVGVWHGEYEGKVGPWLRLFYPDGRRLVLTEKEQERLAREAADERAEQERREKEVAVERAEREKEAAVERADAAEIENAHLRARLAELESQDDPS